MFRELFIALRASSVTDVTALGVARNHVIRKNVSNVQDDVGVLKNKKKITRTRAIFILSSASEKWPSCRWNGIRLKETQEHWNEQRAKERGTRRPCFIWLVSCWWFHGLRCHTKPTQLSFSKAMLTRRNQLAARAANVAFPPPPPTPTRANSLA